MLNQYKGTTQLSKITGARKTNQEKSINEDVEGIRANDIILKRGVLSMYMNVSHFQRLLIKDTKQESLIRDEEKKSDQRQCQERGELKKKELLKIKYYGNEKTRFKINSEESKKMFI